MNSTTDAGELLKLAKEKFGQLTKVEKNFFRKVVKGKSADCVNSKQEREILKADRIIWLCTVPEVQKFLTHHGIQISKARLIGKLDFELATIGVPLSFDDCLFVEPIILKQAKTKNVTFKNTKIDSLEAEGIKIDGSLHMNEGFVAQKQINLSKAIINGDLNCSKGKFKGLLAEEINVTGSVYLNNNFKSCCGEVKFSDAVIGQKFDCTDGKFINSNEDALVAIGISIRGDCLLENSEAQGKVDLSRSNIGGNFNCKNGKFTNPNIKIDDKKVALIAQSAKIEGSVFLDQGFQANGTVWLANSTIGKSLECGNSRRCECNTPSRQCNGGKFINPGKNALVADGIKISLHLFLNHCHVEGLARLPSAEIGGNLDCTKSQFNSRSFLNNVPIIWLLFREINSMAGIIFLRSLISFVAEGANIQGSVFLRNGFKAYGKVKISNMNIGSVLDCGAGHFINPGGDALLAEGIKVKDYASLNKPNNIQFRAEGIVNLRNAEIGKNLECDGGQFINPDREALLAEGIKVSHCVFLRKEFKAEGTVDLRNAKIGNDLELTNIDEPSKMKLELRYAKVGTLKDEENSWSEGLLLDGLTYESISEAFLSPKDSKTRLKWLRLQDRKYSFPLQPYEQLAKILTAKGDEKGATEILIARQDDLLKNKKESQNLLQRIWNCVCRYTVAYGYKPNQALFYIIGLVVVGAFFFHLGSVQSLFWKTRDLKDLSCNYPNFSPILYSLDASIPVINFHQLDFCLPDVTQGGNCGWILQIYFAVHIILGWVFTSLWVAGFTGLIRKPTK